MSKYVDIPSVCEHFPNRIEVPHRLLELLEWFHETINDEPVGFLSLLVTRSIGIAHLLIFPPTLAPLIP